jgi:hypothetical protein
MAMSSASWHFEDLAQGSDFSFPMKTESGIASQEPGGNSFVTLRDSISFGQSLTSWWESMVCCYLEVFDLHALGKSFAL